MRLTRTLVSAPKIVGLNRMVRSTIMDNRKANEVKRPKRKYLEVLPIGLVRGWVQFFGVSSAARKR